MRPRQSYRHEAFLWRDLDGFLAGTVPFIRDGLAADEPVMVAVIQPRINALTAALGDDANRVHFVDMAQLGRNPAQIIPGWQAFLDGQCAADRPVRGIGEPIWAGRRPEEILECQLHEALLNVAVDPETPFWLLCPYNVSNLEPTLIEEAHRSHPAIHEADTYRGSTAYAGSPHVDELFGSALPDLPGQPEQMYVNLTNIHKVLPFVAARALTAGGTAPRAADLAVATHHVATSSLRRAAQGGVVKLWTQTDSVFCEVHDHTHITDPLTGRRARTLSERDGLWLANQICDLVQLRSTTTGTTVRLHHWI